MPLSGKISWARSALLALAWLPALAAPAAASASEPVPPEPPFCQRHVLHDYLAPLAGLPKLREPPYRRTGRGVHFRGLEISASGASLAVGGGSAGFLLDWEENPPDLDLRLTFSKLDWQGRVIRRLGQRHLRPAALAPAITEEPQFSLGGKRGLYRTTLLVRSRSGRKLAEFGNYYRVVKPTVHTRLVANSRAYTPGGTVFARIENPGAAFVLFGEEFKVEKREGETWVPAPESPDVFTMPLYEVAPGSTSGHCTAFPIPPTTSPGEYRISEEAVIGWPTLEGQIRPVLHAEFEVASRLVRLN